MAKKYTIIFNRNHTKEIKKIPPKDRSKIKECLYSLADNPRPPSSKKLKGTQLDLYRVRQGNYRIIY